MDHPGACQNDSFLAFNSMLITARQSFWKQGIFIAGESTRVKNDVKEETGWKLISVSEDQQGLIKVLL